MAHVHVFSHINCSLKVKSMTCLDPPLSVRKIPVWEAGAEIISFEHLAVTAFLNWFFMQKAHAIIMYQ